MPDRHRDRHSRRPTPTTGAFFSLAGEIPESEKSLRRATGRQDEDVCANRRREHGDAYTAMKSREKRNSRNPFATRTARGTSGVRVPSPAIIHINNGLKTRRTFIW